MIIRGREYTVEVRPKPCPEDGKVYIITSKRGHRWYTLRHKPQPALLFLMPEKGTSKTMDRVWLTDKNGQLEVWSQ